MYFGIYGEDEVDNIKLDRDKSILIRLAISYELKTLNLYKNVLNMPIEDMPLECVTKKFKEDIIKDFYRLNKFILENDFDEVIVCCSLGLSRSPAIMICIAQILGSEDLERRVKDTYKFYNRAIVNEFNKYSFIKKDIAIGNIKLKGNFIYFDYNVNLLDELIDKENNNEKEFSFNLIKKKIK